MHVEVVRTAPRSPWQNAYVASYVAYCMRSRTHLGLAKDSPVPRPVQSVLRCQVIGGVDTVLTEHDCTAATRRT